MLMSQGSREQQKTLSSPPGHWLLVTMGGRGEGGGGGAPGSPRALQLARPWVLLGSFPRTGLSCQRKV